MTSSAEIRWHWHRWSELRPDTLYAFLKLRSEIFVVEQNCVFPDMDGIDPDCEHLCGHDASGALIAYLRLVPPGVKHPEPSLGRVVTAASARGTGLGRPLMREGIRHCGARFPGVPILVTGQQHLEAFYASLGFVTFGEPYLEDGIWHVDMRRPAILGAV